MVADTMEFHYCLGFVGPHLADYRSQNALCPSWDKLNDLHPSPSIRHFLIRDVDPRRADFLISEGPFFLNFWGRRPAARHIFCQDTYYWEMKKI